MLLEAGADAEVLDVYGCLIECPDYPSMATLLDVLIEHHRRGLLRISRVKDRWTNPSLGAGAAGGGGLID